MKGGKDNGNAMDPLFPRLHIDDADKGGPRPPPRNKMAPPANNGRSCFVLQASPSNIGSTKQKVVFPTFSVQGSSDLVERYRSFYSDAEKPDLMYNERSCFLEESKNITDDTSRLPERIMRKRCYSEIDDLSRFLPPLEDKSGLNENETIKARSNDNDFESTQVQNNDNRQESFDTSFGKSFTGLEITSEDLVGAIGQTLFWKARKTIVQQQKLFAVQIFELHRLIKVQTLITQKNSNLKKPCTKFPPMNKLLYVTPLEQSSPPVTKPKANTLKLNPSQHHDPYAVPQQLAPPINNVEKRHISQQSSSKPLFFHSLPTNQWMFPVKSPSGGLIYKPMTGPCPPVVGVVAPIHGNCGPIHFSPIDGPMAYGFPANAVGQSTYFQPYAVPLLNSSCRSLEVKQSSVAVPKCEENTENRRCEKLQEELSLFPTTPSVEVPRCDEQRVQVIKVVPHNARSASESAAWIFQSIQEQRKVT